MIRAAYKVAIGLPTNASTKKIETLVLYNTYEELASAVLISQRERLNSTRQGRALLQQVGYT